MVVQYTNRAQMSKAAEITSPVSPISSSSSIDSKDAPTPFLTKTYDMVDNPSTDSIVSWSRTGSSFIVWNSNEFSKELLPRYFKHSNFSSFVRQLNTYGFRKVDPDKWEFANEYFLKGQKHMLKAIHRRKPAAQNVPNVAPNHQHHQHHPSSKQGPVEVGKFGLEGEIERLKRDKNVLMMELVRLRQQQQQTDRDLQMILQRLHITEQRQQQMVSFLAKAMQSPGFLSQLVQQNENKKRLATAAARKKRRLPKQPDDEVQMNTEDTLPQTEGQIVKYQPNNNDPVAMFLHMLNSADLSSAPKMDIPNVGVTLQDGISLSDMHRSRMVEDLSPLQELSDVFSNSSDLDLGCSSSQIQVSPGTLMRFENVVMDQDTTNAALAAASAAIDRENQEQGDGDGDSMPLEDGIVDIPDDDAFWKQMLFENSENDIDFDSMDALSGMEALTLLK